MSVIGLDVGTSGCKAILLGENGTVLKMSYRPYGLITPRPGWVELNPIEVWESVKFTIGELTTGYLNDPVKAISISSMSDTVTPCDEANDPIGNSIVCFDTRNIKEADHFSDCLGRDWIYRITGQTVHPTYTLTKILWIQRNQPEIFKRTKKFLCYEDFITAQLCGEASFSYSIAARTMAFDINKFSWNRKILDIGKIDESNLAAAKPSGSIAGKIRKDLADDFGFSSDVKIITGGHDQPCGALGSGLFKDGYAMDSTGTVEVLLVINNEPVLFDEMLRSNICFWPHVLEGKYCALGQILTAGAAFRWFAEEFGELESKEAEEQKKNKYDLITSRFQKGPSSILFIPNLSGSGTPEFTPYAKGALYGATLNTNKYDFAKALLEGICFELKINIDLLKNAGIKINALHAIGGGANSDIWMQIKADITGMKIEANKFADQCPLGAALLAAYGIGLFDDLHETEGFLKRKSKTYYPNLENQKVYEKSFFNYQKFRSSVYSLYEQI